jgi:hypothetical protein
MFILMSQLSHIPGYRETASGIVKSIATAEIAVNPDEP